MMYSKKEFSNDLYYFLFEQVGDEYFLTYRPSSLISESKKSKKKKIEPKDVNKVLSKIKKLTKDNKKFTKQDLDELVDADGTFLSSKIPFLNQYLTPKKTMDQTVPATRTPGISYLYGLRRYYGESEDEGEDVISEVDFSETFGYEETKDARTYKEAAKIMSEMGIDDPIELDDRLQKLGFSRKLDKSLKKQKERGKCKKCFTKRRLSEKEEIENLQKNKMAKMVEDIITRSINDNELIEKEEIGNIEKLLQKNLMNIKKLAEKEGISLDKLLKMIKKGE
jgi:hypothetical protein